MSSFSEPHPKPKLSFTLKILIGSVVTLLLILAAALGFWMFPRPTSQNEGYAPVQPIPFSHRLHAGAMKMDCRYCHTGAYKSVHATVPSLNVCMNCHSVVKLDSPHIQKLRAAFIEGKPIEWIRVHELPDHVRFNHKRHVLKGVSCETCHGNVREMDVISQKSPLTMGWCLSCHRGHSPPTKLLTETYPGVTDPKGPVAPFSCSTCHY
jgi:hypothetical protein